MNELNLNNSLVAPAQQVGQASTSSTTTNVQSFATALANSQATSEGEDESGLGSDNDATEDRFLALLVAQMRNQDPMNPLENAEVTTQLAQINTVRGIESLGSTMKQLLEKIGGTSSVESASMIGRQVLLGGNAIEIGDNLDGSVIGGAVVPSSTSSVRAEIINRQGEVVRQIDLGAQRTGIATFEWDGKDDDGFDLDPGQYELSVQSAGAEGPVQLAPLVGARVTGVLRGEDSTTLRLDGGRSVSDDDVLGIF